MPVTKKQVRKLLEPDEPNYDSAAALGAAALPRLAALAAESNEFLAAKAVYLAGRIGGPEAEKIVQDAAVSANPDIRVAAAAAAGKLSQPAASEILMGLVGDPDLSVSKVALRSIGPGATKGLFEKVVQLFRQTTMAPLQRVAGEALVRAATSVNPAIQVQVDYNPPGWDVDGEHVVIQNTGTSPLDLSGVRLEDAVRHSFNLNGVSVPAGAQVKVWTKAGTPLGESLYWGRRAAVWNNTGDVVILRDENDDPVAVYFYVRQEPD